MSVVNLAFGSVAAVSLALGIFATAHSSTRDLSDVPARPVTLTGHSDRGAPSEAFVNWESPHVHPIDMTPDGSTLLAVNVADNRLEVWRLDDGGPPEHVDSIPVGLDPVTVRARTNTEVWVVNHISDSVSVVDLTTGNVVGTIATKDEPADVVFAGSPERAFVSCSQVNVIQVFDPLAPGAAVSEIPILGEEPKSLAVSADGGTVYAAIFQSGNNTTILGGGSLGGFVPNVVNEPGGPWGGVNPPPNDGQEFRPAQNPDNPAPPRVGLIVRKNDQGRWLDDNGGDWTTFVTGAQAALSGRMPGWNLYDHDLAKIDASGLGVTYETGLMTTCMALGVNPLTGQITVVGTEALNEIRYEPVLNGRFLRVNAAFVSPTGVGAPGIADLNPHLTYSEEIPFEPIPQSERDMSIGDPRAIVWRGDGLTAYVAGMGSNNVVVIDAAGGRAGLSPTIEVGEGPTGLALDEARDRLYVMNKFEGSISVVSLTTEQEEVRLSFFDPTPDSVRVGRKHLYDTHKTSGLGIVSCAACHVDARMDGLAWDLGDPSGEMKAFDQNCISGGCEDWHPMKGPMTTQTMRDIIGLEPLHWRGDRFGIEEFNGAYVALQGDDAMLTAAEMQEFEDFLASIHYPPNPFRTFDNGLPTDLALDGHTTVGRFAPPGQPLPNGDAQAGLNAYRFASLDGVQCVTCHTLPTGAGRDGVFGQGQFTQIPPGVFGEHHLGVVAGDGSTNVTMKISHLRNQYEKTGFNTAVQLNTAGFGFLHDGSVPSLERFLAEPVFSIADLQMLADLTAFMLAFSGSDLPEGSPTSFLEPPGPPGRDTHAAVGEQTTLVDLATASSPQAALLDDMLTLADTNRVGLVVKGLFGGERRGFAYVGGGLYQSDRDAEVYTDMALRNAAGAGEELTWTVVVKGTETRIGIDRDMDGYFDADEQDAGTDPADGSSFPGGCVADFDGDGSIGSADLAALLGQWGVCDAEPCGADFNRDGEVSPADLSFLLGAWGPCPAPVAPGAAPVERVRIAPAAPMAPFEEIPAGLTH